MSTYALCLATDPSDHGPFADELPHRCNLDKGHDGDHMVIDTFADYAARVWPRSLEERATPTVRVPRTRRCPKCKSVLAYARRGDDPWAYCTNPDCDYQFD